jgi:light-regulated signal transduction histidine kinase (bacteriophytochrome)
LTDPDVAPWRDAAQRAGVRSGAAMPIREGDSVVGAICLYAKDPGFFIADIFPTLDEMALDVSFALGVYAREAERKRIERELESSHRLLEHRVAQRTGELAASNEELSAFSYSVSHDLRAPLRAIAGFSSMLEEEHSQALSSEAKNLLGRVRNAVHRMDMLIEALLGLARLNRHELQLQRFDLSELVEQVADELASGDPQRSVEFRIAKQAIVMADLPLLRVVMQNLLGNAWKYTARRSPTLIEFGIETGASAEREFFVRDNGVGFDMTYAHKLFTPFQRLHSDAQYQGTGIGLATVRRIIARHGGRVRASGEPERGASFYFTVPESRDGPHSAGAAD